MTDVRVAMSVAKACPIVDDDDFIMAIPFLEAMNLRFDP